jgi:radical SAM superfamily enzyme YgiQ (UPF0313 family)
MKITLLNLPNKNKVMRRYICSYNAPNFLLCPQELLYLGTILKKLDMEITLIDAIAEELSTEKTIDELGKNSPGYIISIIGFECFQEDIEVIDIIKDHFPETNIILIGHYPTIFSEEILNKSKADIIIRGEPELTAYQLIEAIKNGKDYSSMEGIAIKKGDKIIVNKVGERIRDYDELPIPDRSLLKNDLYYEPFFGKPYTTIQTARGCPFSCNYCVKTFGTKTSMRTPENIMKEIRNVYFDHGIKHFRFMDDTFTVNKSRVKELCRMIISEGIRAKWTCLSRIDTIDEETIKLMKNAGCVRIYLGIESGSQKVLDYFNKNQKKEIIIPTINIIKKYGIQVMGFFIIGSPIESEDDFKQSVELAKESKLDFIIVGQLIPYSGTPLFEKLKGEINFSLFPYKNEFKDKEISSNYHKLEKKFYKQFYFRPSYILKRMWGVFSYPKESISSFMSVVTFLFSSRLSKSRSDLY